MELINTIDGLLNQSLPKVSVVVCTYNGESFIREQLDSILQQTYPLYEVIVQDDRSTDSTPSIIQEYVTQYPSIIKFYRNKENLFWNQNFYSAILKTTGDLIALCDQDDYWLPDKIECQVKRLCNSNALLTVCSHWLWENDVLESMIIKPGSLLQLFFNPRFSGHLMMFRSAMLDYLRVGIEADMAHDMFLGIVATAYNKIDCTNDLLVKWRCHSSTATKHLIHNELPRVDGGRFDGKKKVLDSLFLLLKQQKSEVVTRVCGKYIKVYSSLPVSRETRLLVFFVNQLRKQTLWSYFRASLLFCFIGNEIVPRVSNVFVYLYLKATFLFKWWYDHRYDL